MLLPGSKTQGAASFHLKTCVFVSYETMNMYYLDKSLK